MLSFPDARRKVIEVVKGLEHTRRTEIVGLAASLGRVLASPVVADRDYPPFDRATRDGYAARSADLREPGAVLNLVGEIRAGQAYAGAIAAGQCVQKNRLREHAYISSVPRRRARTLCRAVKKRAEGKRY